MGRKVDSDKVKAYIRGKMNNAIEESKGQYEQKYCKEWYAGYIEACGQLASLMTKEINKGNLD